MAKTASVQQSLIKFPASRSVDCRLLPEAMRLAVVFGRGGEKVIFVTDSDEVFSFGSSNSSGVHVARDGTRRTPTPTRVDQLCGKKVAYIATGSDHVLALTTDGDVYAWGSNSHYQLGNGKTSQLFSPQLCRGLQGRRVKQIACGSNHSLALTDTRDVFGWGYNNNGQIGTGDTAPATTPLLVKGLPSSTPVEVIRCGEHSSFALTAAGTVHGWGQNDCGQLGIGTKNHEPKPQRVGGQLSVKFKDVACGSGLSLAVSDAGDLYAWGYVSEDKRSTEILNIMLVATEGKKIVDIAASLHSKLSAALTSCGQVLILGSYKGVGIIESPRVTTFPTLVDAFVDLSVSPVTFKPLDSNAIVMGRNLTSEEDEIGVVRSFERHFDNEELSNVKFLVEGKIIYGHVSVLRIRSEYLRAMLSSNWDKGNREIEVKTHSYGTFRSYLKYLYTGRLEVNELDVIGFLRLTNEYLEVDLKRRCEELALSSVTIDNAFEMYITAKQMSAKTLEASCAKFIMSNLSAVTSTESYKSLDSQITKDFLQDLASSHALKD